MKEQLTLEWIAPYLPYGLKVSCFFKDNNGELSFEREGVIIGIKTETNPDRGHPIKVKTRSHPESRFYSELAYIWDEIKPHLRPLSQLTEEIEYNGERFTPTERLFDDDSPLIGADFTPTKQAHNFIERYKEGLCYPLEFWQQLYKYHFDINGLIEKGLAIEIPSLKEEVKE